MPEPRSAHSPRPSGASLALVVVHALLAVAGLLLAGIGAVLVVADQLDRDEQWHGFATVIGMAAGVPGLMLVVGCGLLARRAAQGRQVAAAGDPVPLRIAGSHTVAVGAGLLVLALMARSLGLWVLAPVVLVSITLVVLGMLVGRR